jgi:hypothetical protein
LPSIYEFSGVLVYLYRKAERLSNFQVIKYKYENLKITFEKFSNSTMIDIMEFKRPFSRDKKCKHSKAFICILLSKKAIWAKLLDFMWE